MFSDINKDTKSEEHNKTSDKKLDSSEFDPSKPFKLDFNDKTTANDWFAIKSDDVDYRKTKTTSYINKPKSSSEKNDLFSSCNNTEIKSPLFNIMPLNEKNKTEDKNKTESLFSSNKNKTPEQKFSWEINPPTELNLEPKDISQSQQINNSGNKSSLFSTEKKSNDNNEKTIKNIIDKNDSVRRNLFFNTDEKSNLFSTSNIGKSVNNDKDKGGNNKSDIGISLETNINNSLEGPSNTKDNMKELSEKGVNEIKSNFPFNLNEKSNNKNTDSSNNQSQISQQQQLNGSLNIANRDNIGSSNNMSSNINRVEHRSLNQIFEIWKSDINNNVNSFHQSINVVKDWDYLIIKKSNEVNELNNKVNELKALKDKLFGSIEIIKNHQVHYVYMLKEIDNFINGNRFSLDNKQLKDSQRENVYNTAAKVDSYIINIKRQINDFVFILNNSADVSYGSSNKIGYVMKILNYHLNTLIFIEGRVKDLENRIASVRETISKGGI